MIEANLHLTRGEFSLNSVFQVPGKGVTAIYGPSGCGKTSLLRCLAGLDRPEKGFLRVGEETWFSDQINVPTHRRRVGFVFQQPSLFTHLSVAENLTFGHKRCLIQDTNYFNQLIDNLSLSSLLKRSTEQLSGGESQRVALGRALLAQPRVLLLDEPLSALDNQARSELMCLLENIFQHLDITIFYVSHSPDEVARLADHLLLMEQGQVISSGPISQVLADIDSPLARAEDAFSVLNCRVVNADLPGLTAVATTGGQTIHLLKLERDRGVALRLRIQARDISLCLEKPEMSSIINILKTNIIEISKVSASGQRTIKLALGGDVLLAKVSDYSCSKLKLMPGMSVYAQIKSVAVLV